MNVTTVKMMSSWALIIIFVGIPHFLSGFDIGLMEWALTPIVTMATFVIIGMIWCVPHLNSPIKAVSIMLAIILGSLLISLSMY